MSFLTIFAAFVSQILAIRYLFVKSIRINARQFVAIYKASKEPGAFKFITSEEFTGDNETGLPSILIGLIKSKDIPLIHINQEERSNQTGHTPTTVVCTILVARWNYNRLVTWLSNRSTIEGKTIPIVDVYITSGKESTWLGDMQVNNNIILPSEIKPIEEVMLTGEVIKSNFLLYGPPGNGKTTIIRNLAIKYGYHVYIYDFAKGCSNVDILTSLRWVPKKTIVLIEDFDSVYHGRTLVKFADDATFSYDAVLNLLDGIYQNNKQVIFAFTCNDISKLDGALLDRPSRIKYKIFIDNPTFENRMEILGDIDLALNTDGCNLDDVYYCKDYASINGKDAAIKKFKKTGLISLPFASS